MHCGSHSSPMTFSKPIISGPHSARVLYMVIASVPALAHVLRSFGSTSNDTDAVDSLLPDAGLVPSTIPLGHDHLEK